MPELPEVETTLRGIKPSIIKQQVTNVILRHPHLRWPIPADLKETLVGHSVMEVVRRAKYLLFIFENGTLILHLGMSGYLRILSDHVPPGKHDHVDIYFSNGKCLRFNDPRRFGALLWTNHPHGEHPLLKNIGPEPLSVAFNGEYLWHRSRKKKASVKALIMDNRVVAGVGNIYATESLFMAGIYPKKAAGKVSLADYHALVSAIKKVLVLAIEKGGTTLKDFRKSDGTPGYFSLALKVYGKAGKPCPRCEQLLKSIRILNRATVYCPACQR